jgi:hypothetical protein
MKNQNKTRVTAKKRVATKPQEENLFDAIRKVIAPLGGVTLPDIPREPMREPPDFSDWYPNRKKKRL